jgi:hypothetical protein
LAAFALRLRKRRDRPLATCQAGATVGHRLLCST